MGELRYIVYTTVAQVLGSTRYRVRRPSIRSHVYVCRAPIEDDRRNYRRSSRDRKRFMMLLRVILGALFALLVSWGVLVSFLVLARPKGSLLREAMRILPDTLRLLRRLATDSTPPRGVRVRLWLIIVYLALPVDIIPDFIPVIGYADDAIIVCAVLRSVVRRAGSEAVRRHWPGTEDGLATLWRVAGLSGASSSSQGGKF